MMISFGGSSVASSRERTRRILLRAASSAAEGVPSRRVVRQRHGC